MWRERACPAQQHTTHGTTRACSAHRARRLRSRTQGHAPSLLAPTPCSERSVPAHLTRRGKAALPPAQGAAFPGHRLLTSSREQEGGVSDCHCLAGYEGTDGSKNEVQSEVAKAEKPVSVTLGVMAAGNQRARRNLFRNMLPWHCPDPPARPRQSPFTMPACSQSERARSTPAIVSLRQTCDTRSAECQASWCARRRRARRCKSR